MPERALQDAVAVFQRKTDDLRAAIDDENRSRKTRERRVGRILNLLVGVLALLLMLGGFGFHESRTRINDNKRQIAAVARETKMREVGEAHEARVREHALCVVGAQNRESQKKNLITLVEFALAAFGGHSPQDQATARRFVVAYRKQLNHDLPKLICR